MYEGTLHSANTLHMDGLISNDFSYSHGWYFVYVILKSFLGREFPKISFSPLLDYSESIIQKWVGWDRGTLAFSKCHFSFLSPSS